MTARSAQGSRRHTQRDQEPIYKGTGEDEVVCAYDTGEAHSWGCEGGDQGEVGELGRTFGMLIACSCCFLLSVPTV
jgi:hypothetical protein